MARRCSDLFGSPLVLRTGAARLAAVRALRKCGHPIPERLSGRAKVLALYTDPNNRRGVLLRRLKSGRVGITRYGNLMPAEVDFLHSLASEVKP